MARKSKTNYFKLSHPQCDRGQLSPFSLVPWHYEQEIAEQNGHLDLCNTRQLQELDEAHEAHYRKLVPMFSRNGDYSKRSLQQLVEKVTPNDNICSLRVDSNEDLFDHALCVYQVSYAHYVLGKKENIKGIFPNYCCGYSSGNVMLSLIAHGYPMTAIASDELDDHTYVLLPFVLKEKNKGVLVCDPTSDQLWKNIKRPPRNALFFAKEGCWTYETNWGDGVDLYPTRVLSLLTVREMIKAKKEIYGKNIGLDYEFAHTEVRTHYFAQAFSNPVRVKKLTFS